jgi:orotidine-5'-phosphate decarboxylase
VSEIAVAFDVPTLEAALALDRSLGPGPEWAKVGLQLYTSAGPDAVRALRERGRRVFLDLKLHDIPNTVRGAAAEAARLGAELLTVHATGGPAMVGAAVEGAGGVNADARVVAVTILTSLDPSSMPPGFQSPFRLEDVGQRLLSMSLAAGAAGIVCSPADLPAFQAAHGKPFFAVTPGIRPSGAPADDQQRVSTVSEAIANGAGLLVIGRAITRAPDPRAALEAAREERDRALAVKSAPGVV